MGTSHTVQPYRGGLATGMPPTMHSWRGAGLAGIGAVLLATAVLSAISVELWFLRIVVTDGPPPRVNEFLLLTWGVGAFVAMRLGGFRGLVPVGLYALATVMLIVLDLIIYPMVDCALRPSLNCFNPRTIDLVRAEPWVLASVTGMTWIVPGLLFGTLAAILGRVAIPLRSGLVALSVFAWGYLATTGLLTLVRTLGRTVCSAPDAGSVCSSDAEYFVWFAAHVVLGLLASRVLIRAGGRATDALVLGGVLFICRLPGIVHQIGMLWGDGFPTVLGQFGGSVGTALFVLVTIANLHRRPFARAESNALAFGLALVLGTVVVAGVGVGMHARPPGHPPGPMHTATPRVAPAPPTASVLVLASGRPPSEVSR